MDVLQHYRDKPTGQMFRSVVRILRRDNYPDDVWMELESELWANRDSHDEYVADFRYWIRMFNESL